MKNYFETQLCSAIDLCDNRMVEYGNSGFLHIYPFTNENINGYIDFFDLKNHSLCTVGSSLDQTLNAIYKGCRDITVIDICPYTKFYYYLKVACIFNLEYDEYFKFLSYLDYPKVFKYNQEAFDLGTYDKISPFLRILDYESYLFWDELFHTFSGSKIRTRLFDRDENRHDVVLNCNTYLLDANHYQDMRIKILSSHVNFIIDDIFKHSFDRFFDNIWLSNIATYYDIYEIFSLVCKLNLSLSNQGKLMISYLWNTTIDSKYQKNWSSIYDLKNDFLVFQNFSPILLSFHGTDHYKFKDSTAKDSALIYQKKR